MGALANHGRLNPPTVIDYVQDRRGQRCLWRADTRPHELPGAAIALNGDGKPKPRLGIKGVARAMDARNPFPVMHILARRSAGAPATGAQSAGANAVRQERHPPPAPRMYGLSDGVDAADGGRVLTWARLTSRATWAAMPYGGTIAAPDHQKCMIEKTAEQVERVASGRAKGVQMGARRSTHRPKQVVEGWPHRTITRSAIIWEAFKPDT